MQGAEEFLLIAIMSGLLLIGLLVYAIVALYIRLRRAGENKPPTHVGFVVDTFHGLVAQLKEKEAELDALRKLAEKRAEVMEDYNEYILQSVPSGVVSMDEQWRIVKMNASAAKILQADPAECVGQDGREVFDDLLGAIARRHAAVGGAGTEDFRITRGQCQHRTSSGRPLWLGYNLTPLMNDEGGAIGRLLVFTDLTELRALEEQAELRKRLSSLGEMAAGIAHELRNPMAVIAGYMRMLRKREDPAIAQVVEAVSDEVSVMDRIIEDFLSFARPRELRKVEVDLSALVRMCALKVDPKDVQLTVDTPEGVRLELDEVMMRQAITNLLQNAIEATPRAGRVALGLRQDEGRVIMTVSDTGHGIDESIKSKLFDPFFTTKDHGTGLGLAVVHRTVTAHGGRISVESAPGRTTFTVSLTRGGTEPPASADQAW